MKHIAFLAMVLAVAVVGLLLSRERAREYETWRDYLNDEDGMFV